MKLVLLLKIFVRCQNKEMTSMASDGNYIDSYGHLLVNSDFIFIYLVCIIHMCTLNILYSLTYVICFIIFIYIMSNFIIWLKIIYISYCVFHLFYNYLDYLCGMWYNLLVFKNLKKIFKKISDCCQKLIIKKLN